eukprot:4457222-Alexandrium_andersonii.AAC.1
MQVWAGLGSRSSGPADWSWRWQAQASHQLGSAPPGHPESRVGLVFAGRGAALGRWHHQGIRGLLNSFCYRYLRRVSFAEFVEFVGLKSTQ